MRRTLSAVLLSATFAATQAFTGMSAQAQTPACFYPVSSPLLSASVVPIAAGSGVAVTISGALTKNTCTLASRRVGLFARETAGAPYVYQKQTVTDSLGNYSFRYGSDETVDLLVIFSGDAQYSRAVSAKQHLSVLS